MLKELEIKNFQSHIKTKLKFSKGINGIIGLSQAGKTAIIRSISLIKDNRPLGFAFHNKYTEQNQTKVSMLFYDDTKISFSKNIKNKAVYQITNKDQKKVKFTKFSKAIPPLIKQQINLSKINIHSQLDSPFLITSPSGEISREINKITNSETATLLINQINKKISYLKVKKETLTNDVEEIKNELKKIKNLDEIEDAIKKLENVKKAIAREEDDHFFLTETQEKIKQFQKKISRLKKISKTKIIVRQIDQQKKDIETASIEIKLLKDYQQQKLTMLHKKNKYKILVNDYVHLLKKEKKCPTCFSKINSIKIRIIHDELTII